MEYQKLMEKINEYKKTHLNQFFKNNKNNKTAKVIDFKFVDNEYNQKYEKLNFNDDNSDVLKGIYLDFNIIYRIEMQTYDMLRVNFDEQFTKQS